MTWDDWDEAQAKWRSLMASLTKAGERDRYLLDHPNDPEFDRIHELSRRSARRFGERCAELAEWLGDPDAEVAVRTLAGKCLAAAKEA